ncbi:MAG: SDR family oxidoreductase [Chromatiales bacterium]|nr:SDR family oxidoreductase [Chromatiales bacterium]
MKRTGLLLSLLALAGILPEAALAGGHGATERVLVTGATGRTGQLVVEQLLEQGRTVRVLARNAEGARGLFGDRVEIAVGDVRNPASLPSALEGVTGVISTIGASPRRQEPDNNPEAVDYHGTRNLVAAAVAAGSVEHFVLLTSMGVTQPNHILNRVSDNVLLWKALGENALRFSSLDYTIVRPGGLIDEPGGQAGIRAGQGDSMPQTMIPRADVAAVCVNALGNPEAVNKTLEIVSDLTATGVNWSAFFSPLKADERQPPSF